MSVQEKLHGFIKGKKNMFKKVFIVLSLSTFLSAFTVHYDVHMEFKRGKTPDESKNSFMINGEKVKCKCGRAPSYLLFCYGVPEAFCYKHLPIKDEVPEISFEDIVSTQEGNENGSNEIKK